MSDVSDVAVESSSLVFTKRLVFQTDPAEKVDHRRADITEIVATPVWAPVSFASFATTAKLKPS
jgi:hypothetical protein